MRFEKVDNILQLALEMQAARAGLTLQDIQTRYGVGRRTAMRMKDTIMRNFPQAEEVPTSEKVKRWRIPPGVLDKFVHFTADELADLNKAIKIMVQENLDREARSLEGLSTKLGTLLKPEDARKAEPDIEALLEAEGLAMRAGPRPLISDAVITNLREAVKGCVTIKIGYRSWKGKLNERLVQPYGFLFGQRHYLVGFHLHPKANKFTLFRLSEIESVELTGKYFDRDPSFSIEEFAQHSFGVFQEEQVDVEWRFLPKAAKAAKEFLFHPSQTLEECDDGSLVVKFKAGGLIEMAWHLYKWGENVEVIKPKKLAKMMLGQRVNWEALP